MKKNLLILSLLLIFTLCAQAQDTASALWGLLNKTTEATLSGQLQNPNFSVIGLAIKDSGGPDGCVRITKETAWHDSEDADYYIEFSVQPKEGTIFNVSEISFLVCGSGGGNMRANFYYSKDATFAQKTQINYKINEDLTRDNSTGLDTASVSINEEVLSSERLYFRIYPYYKSVSTGKHICLKDVIFNGTTTATAVEVSAIWPFITDLKPVISGALLAQNMTYGSNARQYEWDARITIDGTAVNNGTFCTKPDNCAWIAATDIQDDVYVQYAVSPKIGATLTVNSVSLMIAATGTNNMMAAVYASKSADFSTKTLLKENTILMNQELQLWNISLNTPEIIASGETYYIRVYPYHKTDATYKLVGVRNVTISGTMIGATVDPAEVTTESLVNNISTTSATIGGTVTNDGGAAVTARGIVWSTANNPTIDDLKTEDGDGSGSFTSTLSGLTAATTYYARAYATNKAGTAYGNEVSFTTLAQLVAPSVTTISASDIRNTSIIVSGNVTSWGGTNVTERGVVWSTTNNPTINENKVESGEGLGSFKAFIDSLSPETTYYVRTYAINSTGIAYGSEITVTTKATDPDVTKVIAQDGTGNYTTVQAAFDDVPLNYTGKWIIRIKPGTYNERPSLAKNKINVYLVGEDALTTVITHNTSSGTPKPEGGTWGTSNCQTVEILANDFTAINVTFENSFVNSKANAAENKDTQAVALKTQGDRQSFYNCRIVGYQDTYLGNSIGRAYFKNCFIEGNVDFIFGRQTVVFDQCTTYVNREGSVIVAPATEKNTKFGMVFLDCNLTTMPVGELDFDNNTFTSFYLGRPWKDQPKAAFIRCNTPSSLHEKGWTTMNGGLNPVFVEFGGIGEGATADRLAKRGNEGIVITEEEASVYTVANVFKKDTDPSFYADWMPEEAPDENIINSVNNSITDTQSSSYAYPNPFTNTININFTLTNGSRTIINLYNINGRLINKIKDEQMNAGNYTIEVDGSSLTSGVYFYSIHTDWKIETQKIIKK